jgi:hypothetical protein
MAYEATRVPKEPESVDDLRDIEERFIRVSPGFLNKLLHDFAL